MARNEVDRSQLVVSYVLVVLVGALKSLPVFTASIVRNAEPRGSLDKVWPLSLALAYPITAPLMVLFGVYLHGAESRTTAARRLGLLAAVGYLALVVAAVAVACSSRVLLFAAGVAAGIPSAAKAVFIIQHAAAVAPQHLGIILGIASFAYGSSVAVATWIANILLNRFSTPMVLFTFGITLAVSTAVVSRVIVFPSDEDLAAPDSSLNAANEQTGLLLMREEPQYAELTVRKALGNRALWFFVLSVSFKRVSYPLEAYFFQMGSAYGETSDVLLGWFQTGTILTILFKFMCYSSCDYAKTSSGALQSGPRNVLSVVLLMQIAAFVIMTVSSWFGGGFVIWAIVVTLLRVTAQAYFGIVAQVAKDVFGPRNVALMNGSAGGLALCVGEAFSTAIVAFLVGSAGPKDDLTVLMPFYRLGVLCSASSLIFLLLLRRQIVL